MQTVLALPFCKSRSLPKKGAMELTEPELSDNSALDRLGQGGLEPCRLGQVHPEPVTPALVLACHFGRGMPQLLLDIAFIDFGA